MKRSRQYTYGSFSLFFQKSQTKGTGQKNEYSLISKDRKHRKNSEDQTMNKFAQARTNMVDCQIHTNGVITPTILSAFETVERQNFVPDSMQKIAYCDDDLQVAENRYILEPITHAKMIESVAPQKNDVVLDIGGTTGYSAAILSSLTSTVIALENDSALLSKAQYEWNKMDACNIVAIEGPLNEGNTKNTPYNIILVNGAVAEIPDALLNQLAENGRLIAIVKPAGNTVGDVTIIHKTPNESYSTQKLFSAGAHYLPGFEPKETFNF